MIPSRYPKPDTLVEHEIKPDEDPKAVSEWTKHADFLSDKELKAMTQDDTVATMSKKRINEFLWTPSPQPHAIRRRAILKAHPELEELYGADMSQVMQLVFAFGCQLAMVNLISKFDIGWWYLVAVSYVFGATLNHMLFSFLHECSHRTVFESRLVSEVVCVLSVVPMGLPAAIPFKRYHLDHHLYQGVYNLDPDLPSRLEAKLVNSKLTKLIWITFMPLIYSLRPMLLRPKTFQFMDGLCWFLVASSDLWVVTQLGVKSMAYLLLGTFFAFNFHPCAGHFITEHYVFNTTNREDIYQETFSYYGWFNKISLNLGYHNEHHDFPRIPGSRLPIVTQIAKEFYAMPNYDSWWLPVFSFILSDDITCFNRVLRKSVRGGEMSAYKDAVKHKCDIPGGGNASYWPIVASLFAPSIIARDTK